MQHLLAGANPGLLSIFSMWSIKVLAVLQCSIVYEHLISSSVLAGYSGYKIVCTIIISRKVYMMCRLPPVLFLLRMEHGGLLPNWESCKISVTKCLFVKCNTPF